MDSKKKINVDFENPHTTNEQKEQTMKLQDLFKTFSEESEFVQEINAQVLLGEIELSEKSKRGLASLIYRLGDLSESFEFQLDQLQQKPLQRFTRLMLRNDTLIQYFDEKKHMMDIKAIWEDFPDLSEGKRFMLTFALMVWNPPRHRYPKTKKFKFLQELRHLNVAERQLVFDWASNPFFVNDQKGRLIHHS